MPVVLPAFCMWKAYYCLRGNSKLQPDACLVWVEEGQISMEHLLLAGIIRRAMSARNLKDKFETTEIEGLCTFVPPSYIEKFPVKHPKLYSFLCRVENRLKTKWPWKNIGDYYIISLRRK